jgi:large repetitive protein
MVGKLTGQRWLSVAAGILAVVSVLASGAVLMAPAANAAAPIVIDDFSGHTAGPRTVTLEPTANSTTTQAQFSQANGLGTMTIFGNGNTAGAVQLDYDLPHLDLTSQGNNTQFFLVFPSINRSDAQPGDTAADISISLTGGGITGTFSTGIGNTTNFNVVLNFSCTSNPVCFTPQPDFTDVTHVTVTVSYPQNQDPNGTLTAVIDSINTTPTGGSVPPPASPTITGPASPDFAPAGTTLQFPVQFSSEGIPATVFSAKTAGNLGPGDVTVGGTAGGVSNVAVSGSGANYTISVGPLSSSGTVVVSIAAGAAVDTWAQPTLASNVFTVDYEIPVPPAFTGPAPPDATVGQAYSYQFQAGGIPAATYSFTSGSLPTGLTMDTSGLVSGTPAAGTGGVYPLTVQATNLAASVSETVQLTVNEAPAITSSAPPAAVVGSPYSFTFTATGFPAPTFAITGTLPSGLTLDSSTGVLSGTPAAGTGGTYNLVLSAANSAGTATQNVVLDVNQAPAFTGPPPPDATVGQGYSYQFQAGGIPGATYSLAPGSLPTGLTMDPSGLVSGTPAAGTGGVYPLTVQAANVAGSVSETVQLTVNQAPAITSSAPPAAVVGSPYSFTFAATGFPAPTFIISGTLPSGLTLDSSTGVLSGTPDPLSGGTYNLVLSATNIVSTATEPVVLTVDEAPAITSADQAIFGVGVAGTFTITTTGFPVAAITENPALPSGLTFTDNGDGTATIAGTPAVGTEGTTTETVTATNSTGAAQQTLTIEIDLPPAFTSSAPPAAVVNTAYSFTFTATGFPTPTFSISGTLPSALTLDSSTGVLSGIPAAGTAGTYDLVVSAANSVSTVTQNVVLDVDQAPAFTGSAPPDATVGQAYSYQFQAGGVPAATYSLAPGSLPTGLTMDASGLVSGTPAVASGGVYSLTVEATNVVSSVSETVPLTVDEAPAITGAAPPKAVVGTAYSFTFTASGFPAPTFSITGTLPSGLTLDSATGVLSGTPDPGTGGTYNLVVSAANSVSTATQTFTIKVKEAPAFTSSSSATFQVGVKSTFTVTASGYPTPSFTMKGTLPKGLTFADTRQGTATISGTPAAGTAGSHTVIVNVTNDMADPAQSLTLTVLPASAPPASSPPPASGTQLTSSPAAASAAATEPASSFGETTETTLPSTGIDVRVLVLTALGLVLLGAILLAFARIRRSHRSSRPA